MSLLEHQKLDMEMRKHKSQASRSSMEVQFAVSVLAFVLHWVLSLMDDERLCYVLLIKKSSLFLITMLPMF